MKENVTVLGATGSVGRAALDVITSAGPEHFQVAALTARRDVEGLARSARATNARYVAIADDSLYAPLKERLAGSNIPCGAGPNAVCEAARLPAHRIVCAVSGNDGMMATAAAIDSGAIVALANKESLVCAGPILMQMAKKSGATLIPIDSEHNAIFQVLSRTARVEKLVLTASGGPFRTRSASDMGSITPAEAKKHPTWSMGAKISVDSATMMNKGLELIEAVYLFDVAPEHIDIVVHPQSVIHSMVAYGDGSVLAQMGMPDMRTPIAYALSYPQRMTLTTIARLDLAALGTLDFEAPDCERFPCLDLARHSLELGPWGPVVLSSANEVAVNAFLHGVLRFNAIAELVSHALDSHARGDQGLMTAPTCLEEVQNLILSCRQTTGQLVSDSGRLHHLA